MKDVTLKNYKELEMDRLMEEYIDENFTEAMMNSTSYYIKVSDNVYLATYQATMNAVYLYVDNNKEKFIKLNDSEVLEDSEVREKNSDYLIRFIGDNGIIEKTTNIIKTLEFGNIYMINNLEIIKYLY